MINIVKRALKLMNRDINLWDKNGIVALLNGQLHFEVGPYAKIAAHEIARMSEQDYYSLVYEIYGSERD